MVNKDYQSIWKWRCRIFKREAGRSVSVEWAAMPAASTQWAVNRCLDHPACQSVKQCPVSPARRDTSHNLSIKNDRFARAGHR